MTPNGTPFSGQLVVDEIEIPSTKLISTFERRVDVQQDAVLVKLLFLQSTMSCEISNVVKYRTYSMVHSDKMKYLHLISHHYYRQISIKLKHFVISFKQQFQAPSNTS